ncbi:rhotekin-2 isoform X1 [Pygocentrus nattereri]|uniref:REM-1 domain-containing protein n=1 Tax=Pygocentrus nattereri TaxID=42514 RepID=A0A3B4CAL7_PYGNA|nr:rhotekin-2 isoform X1 [Pygocentrus nattereri]
MELPRDGRFFRRNVGARSTVSSCSSFAMEVKRKKIRESTLFLQNEATARGMRGMKRCTSLNDTEQIIEDMNLLYIRQISKKLQDCDIQEKMDFEMRMRAGAYKLLVASTKREQILDAAKSLITCNARIKAYMAEAQRRKEQQDMAENLRRRSLDSQNRVACKGKVAISGLRIPLFWKDSEHFSNKGNSQRMAVFCLMKMGSEIFDTEMVIVDQSVTDICFEGVTIFSEAKPDFELAVELYSCAVEEEVTLVNTPKKLARKFRSSLGKASGKKLCPALDGGDPDAFLESNPMPPGVQYSLLAYTSLCLEQAEGSFQSHSLIVLQNVAASSWLPLYGNLCCQLVAQPHCMTQDMMSGYLSQQQSIEGLQRCCRLYCVLKAGLLSCYFTPEEIQAKVEPSFVIPINKDTRIRVVEGHQKSGSRLSLINPGIGDPASHVFTAETPEQLQDWLNALWQHIHDKSQWQHTSDRLMEIQILSPRKPPLFLTKQADSVYNDLSIGSPGKFESLTDIIHNKIEETDGRFLIGQEEQRESPHWAALFEGSHSMVVQKTVLSPGKEDAQSTSSPTLNSNKKRRAPPPPPDKLPFVQPVPCLLEKENSCKAMRPRTGRPSLDAKFSAIIQQLQKTHAPPRKNPPLAQIEPSRNPYTPKRDIELAQAEHTEKMSTEALQPPIPAPRNKLRKSFREKINPKAW